MHISNFYKNIFLICLIILSNLYVVSSVKNDITNNNEESCFGYIIPLPSGKDTTYETLQNSKVRFLINDLLREKIDVFWSNESFNTLCKSFSNNVSMIKFEKGTFIVPFSDDIYIDKLITSIIIDYNISSEIYDNSSNVEIFYLMEKIELNALKLVEPRIAQHYDIPIRYGWPCYLQIAESGGFLNFDFLIEDEVLTELVNDRYNVFMWPYEPDPARFYEVVVSLSNRKEFEKIRSFVSKGGGYIGSCYGALAASSGFLNPLSGFHLLQSYNPSIPLLPFSFTLSMSDSIMMERAEVLNDLYISYSKIHNKNHPITFGINDTVKEFFSGPWFIWLGNNTKTISTFTEVTLGENESEPLFIEKRVENSPSWTVSKFGEGDMVLFTSHPEFINNITFLFENRTWNADQYYGRRVIFNSIMYVTAEKIGTILIDINYPFSFLDEVKNHTINIDIPSSQNKFFKDIEKRLNNYKHNLSLLRNQSFQQMRLYHSTFNESKVYPSESRPLLYTYTFCSILYDYIEKTLNILKKIEDINTLFIKSDYNISNKISLLKNNISKKFNQTINIFNISMEISNNISYLFKNTDRTLYNKSLIIENSRKLITTFEISLKYFPQIYFEALKTTHHEWYNYESNFF